MPIVQKKVARREEATGVDCQEVARVAYELFQQRGYKHGHDLEDWLKAEAIVRRRGRQR